jgi:pimeloyl-ACP methyl ester carboxylesterase
MSDLGWTRDGHNHGLRLARECGFAPVYLFYNSGRHVSTNGREFADQLERLLTEWPVPVRELVIVGHSMGGLVARSACHHAGEAGQAWLSRLSKLMFLGTPHHGAPLERAGNWLHRVMDLSPYVAPFTRLSKLRSDGITDLRHGNLLDADWADVGRFERGDHRTPVPLPAGVEAFAIASTAGSATLAGSLLGDGLVPVDSALGRHRQPRRDLGLPADHRWVGKAIHHLDQLSSPEVYRRLLYWLK